MCPPRGPPDGGSRPGRTPDGFWSHVSRIRDRFDELLPFAGIPLVTALLDVQRVRAALHPAPGSRSFTVEFALPSPLSDLWSLADPPPAAAPPPAMTGSGGHDVTVEAPIPVSVVGPPDGAVAVLGLLGLLAAYALLFSALLAVYVGGIDRRLRGEPVAPGGLVVRYAPRFLVYGLLVFGAALATLPLLLAVPGVVLLAIPLVFVVGYLFYAAPFLFVVEDAGVVEGLRRSYRYAIDGGPYLHFALWHVAVSAVASVGLSVVINGGPGGFLLALAVATPFSLVLTAATVSFLQDLGGAGTGDRGRTASR